MSRSLVLVIAVLFVACGTGDSNSGNGAEPSPSPTSNRETRTVIIEGDEGPVLLNAEVADEPEEWRRGLMGRTSLAEDSGMVFISFGSTTTGFWMKDTHIPLSIAFFARDGEILRILDMDPCHEEPCRVYRPGVTYRGALEVNQGFFEENSISEGDVIRLTP
jgi:uncharacterized membrane protein (UPF0127 family)